MRPKSTNRIAPLALVLLGVMGLAVLVTPWWLQAGGPLLSGGDFGADGLPFTWPTQPISYIIDGGALGQLDNATANARVASLFNVWQAVPTSNIAFLRSGGVPERVDAAAEVWAVDDTPAATEFINETVDFNSTANSDFRPFDFAAAEAIGDYSAFGFAQKFSKLTFDNLNGVKGVGGVVAWEYFNGTIWTALAGVTDGTSNFTAAVADGQVVTFTVPADWATTSINAGAQLFYVRARVTTIYSINPQYDQGTAPDGDINTAAEYNALVCTGNPVIYDTDGQLFIDLGKGANVLGFAGPCFVSSNNVVNSITSGRIALNGKFFDGNGANGELTSNEFDAVFIHEFGHFFGMDHSQINPECWTGGGGCISLSDKTFGLPTMFPILINNLEETTGVHPARTLSADDKAWVSRLYPDATFNTTFGSITGTIYFSDGVTALQGANVIARQVDDPATTTIDESRRNAVSAVSGFFFRADHGNAALGRGLPNFGSGDVSFAGTFEIPGLAPGSYTVEIETLNAAFTGGSSVGPVGDQRNEQFPLPGPAEFYNVGESNIDTPATSSAVSVTAGAATTGINIIVNGTGPRFDSFDAAVRNDSTATATPLNNGAHAASLSPFTSKGDLDVYAFNATSGATVTVDIRSQRDLGAPMDSVVEIVDGAGNQLTTCSATIGGIFNTACVNDNSSAGGTVDSTLHFQSATTGTFYIRVTDKFGDARPEFVYNLVLTGADPAPVGGAVFSNPGAITVNDNAAAAPYPSNITVSGVTGTVTKVVVRLINLNHTAPDDLDILLVGPTGANAIILSDVGGSPAAVGVTLVLDDDAASLIPDAGPLTSGVFQPTNFVTGDTFAGPAPTPSGNVALSVFAGLNPNGTWSLYIVDDLGLDSGSLSGGWSLEIFTPSAKKRRGQITSE